MLHFIKLFHIILIVTQKKYFINIGLQITFSIILLLINILTHVSWLYRSNEFFTLEFSKWFIVLKNLTFVVSQSYFSHTCLNLQILPYICLLYTSCSPLQIFWKNSVDVIKQVAVTIPSNSGKKIIMVRTEVDRCV